jgi:hypothetical protein
MDRVIHLFNHVPIMSVIQMFIINCSVSQAGRVTCFNDSPLEYAGVRSGVSAPVKFHNP